MKIENKVFESLQVHAKLSSRLSSWNSGQVCTLLYHFISWISSKNSFIIKNIFKLYVKEDDNDWFYAVQSNNALVNLADEGKITKKCFIIKLLI